MIVWLGYFPPLLQVPWVVESCRKQHEHLDLQSLSHASSAYRSVMVRKVPNNSVSFNLSVFVPSIVDGRVVVDTR